LPVRHPAGRGRRVRTHLAAGPGRRARTPRPGPAHRAAQPRHDGNHDRAGHIMARSERPWGLARLLYSATLCLCRPGQTSLSMPLARMTTGGHRHTWSGRPWSTAAVDQPAALVQTGPPIRPSSRVGPAADRSRSTPPGRPASAYPPRWTRDRPRRPDRSATRTLSSTGTAQATAPEHRSRPSR
jgi:hypothetical protein